MRKQLFEVLNLRLKPFLNGSLDAAVFKYSVNILTNEKKSKNITHAALISLEISLIYIYNIYIHRGLVFCRSLTTFFFPLLSMNPIILNKRIVPKILNVYCNYYFSSAMMLYRSSAREF